MVEAKMESVRMYHTDPTSAVMVSAANPSKSDNFKIGNGGMTLAVLRYCRTCHEQNDPPIKD